MNWNSLVTSYRFIMKSKIFTVINLTGLTAGLTVSFFLLIYIINELSYDSYHDRPDRIYRVITHMGETVLPYSPSGLPELLNARSGGVAASGGLVKLDFMTGPVTVRSHASYGEQDGFYCADSSILRILRFDLPPEQRRAGLSRPGSILISRSASRTFFGAAEAIGQPLIVTSANITDTLTVTGVFEDLPWNSSLEIDFLAGMDLLKMMLDSMGIDLAAERAAYGDYYLENFMVTTGSGSIREIEEALPGLLDSLGLAAQEISFRFQPIQDIHLGSEEISNDFHKRGNRSSLFYYGSLALAILLLAGINYSILNTARSAMRFKEIGVRKVLGATRRELRMQVLLESILLTSLALPLSFLVLGFAEPYADRMYGYNVQLYTWNMLIYIPLFALITVIIGAISGSYLAIYLSALNPLKALKNQGFTVKRFSLSKVFIVFQLLITLFLLGCVLIIFAQLDYCLNTDSGIRKQNLLIVSFNPAEFRHYPRLRDNLKGKEGVVSVSGSSIIPPSNDFRNIDYTVVREDNTSSTYSLENYYVDNDFFTTLGVGTVAGSDIRQPARDPGDTASAGLPPPVVLNREAAALMELERPIGTSLGAGVVTGIVEDFNIHSFHSKISPAVFTYNPAECSYLVVRCQAGQDAKVRELIRREWEQLAPGLPFRCSTFDDELKLLYTGEKQFGQMVGSFSFLAFLITGMGLFGLALLMIERRLKEIAVRKIFGASDYDILFRMQKEFLIYAAIASVISVPVTWLVMQGWLASFYYRVPMHWYLFVIAILGIILFVSSIIMIRTWTVLRKNLMNVLRYE